MPAPTDDPMDLDLDLDGHKTVDGKQDSNASHGFADNVESNPGNANIEDFTPDSDQSDDENMATIAEGIKINPSNKAENKANVMKPARM